MIEFVVGVLQNMTWDLVKRILQLEQSVEQAVKEVGAKLDEQRFVSARKGAQHLQSACLSTLPDVQSRELILARHEFAMLTALEPTSANLGLIVAGRLGSFYCFLAQQDGRNALWEAYTFTQAFPRVGVKVFPPEVYSTNYVETIAQLEAAITKVKQQYPPRTEWVESSVNPRFLTKIVVVPTEEITRATAPLEQQLRDIDQSITAECEARLKALLGCTTQEGAVKASPKPRGRMITEVGPDGVKRFRYELIRPT